MSDQLVTVRIFGSRDEADITVAALAAAGIESMVVTDDEGGLNPGFFAEYGVRVVVAAEDAAAAENALA
jgi:hypothetical protein